MADTVTTPSSSAGATADAQVDPIEQASFPQTQIPILDTVNQVTPPSNTPDVNSASSPQVQRADSTVDMPQDSSKPSSSNPSKMIIALLILVVVAVMGGLGYYVMTRMSSSSNSQMNEVVTPAPTETIVSPAPTNEQEDVDEIDVTFPESEMKGIETDVQGL